MIEEGSREFPGGKEGPFCHGRGATPFRGRSLPCSVKNRTSRKNEQLSPMATAKLSDKEEKILENRPSNVLGISKALACFIACGKAADLANWGPSVWCFPVC